MTVTLFCFSHRAIWRMLEPDWRRSWCRRCSCRGRTECCGWAHWTNGWTSAPPLRTCRQTAALSNTTRPSRNTSAGDALQSSGQIWPVLTFDTNTNDHNVILSLWNVRLFPQVTSNKPKNENCFLKRHSFLQVLQILSPFEEIWPMPPQMDLRFSMC